MRRKGAAAAQPTPAPAPVASTAPPDCSRVQNVEHKGLAEATAKEETAQLSNIPPSEGRYGWRADDKGKEIN